MASERRIASFEVPHHVWVVEAVLGGSGSYRDTVQPGTLRDEALRTPGLAP